MAELVVALDYPDAEQALHMARQLSGRVAWMKIGLELFCSQGPDIVSRVRDTGCKVFLDLKFHDIPNTVYGAVRSAARTGADMLTLHCSGGEAMLRAAVQAKQDASGNEESGPVLLGVTALTSLDDTQAEAVYSRPASETATHLAQIAHLAGLDGIVCSALEVGLMKKSIGGTFVYLTPGIRLGTTDDDQARIATPQAAVRNGSDYLVVGRPITRADSPAKAAEEFIAVISN